MPSPISNSRTPICLPALAELKTLPTECTLINLSLIRARKGHSVVFKFDDSSWSLPAHIFDGILQR